jgi:peptidoglycan/LPS O-acetylase OafA/YrhL
MTETTRAPATAERLHYVDNLRIALTALVVLHHVAVTYGNIPLWYYTEPAQDASGAVLDVFVVINQLYFMGFFFLLSGFFVPGAHDRKGGGRFVKDRLVRLGVPFLLFTVLVRPLLQIPEAMASPLPYWEYYLHTWDAGPTWFLETLLVFTLVYASVRRRRPAPPPAPASRLTGRTVVAAVAALAVVTFLWRFLVPSGTFIPYLGLPTAAMLPQYAGAFALGIVAFRRGWLTSPTRRAGRIGLAVTPLAAAGLVAAYLLTSGLVQQAAIAVFESVFAAAVVTGLLVLFRSRFDHLGPRGQFLSANALAVYVLHPLVLVGLGYAFAWLAAPALVKFLIVGALALPLCWALAAAVRAFPGMRRIL